MERDLVPFLGLSDPVSALTHLGALAVHLLLARSLLQRARGDPRRLAAVASYVLCVGFMLFASGTYHALAPEHPRWRLFWHLDHGAIWFGLAATFTALMVLVCPPRFSRRSLVFLWSVALVGAALELTALERLPHWVSPLLYIAMAWGVCLPTVILIHRRLGVGPALPLLGAGVLTTAGGLMDALERPNPLPGVIESHELLHFTTVVGWAVYMQFIYRCADGRHAIDRPRAQGWLPSLRPRVARARSARMRPPAA